ncbi:MAG: BatD family protein, partial [bacterium]
MTAPHRAILARRCVGRLAVAGWLLNAVLALAAVEVMVEPNPLELGELGQYQVITDGGTPEIGNLPVVKGLQWTGGPQVSTSVQIINLQITRKATATWTFTVEQPGRYVIPAITVTVGGKPQRLPECVLVVTAPAAVARAVTGTKPGDTQV